MSASGETSQSAQSAPKSAFANVAAGRVGLSQRSRMASLMGVKILGVGAYAPPDVVNNADLAELGYDPAWIVQRTGIHERRRAGSDDATSDLAYEAAIRCLRNSQTEVEDVDLIVVATMSPDHLSPSTACLLQERLGAMAPAFDVNAACSGFMYAISTAAHFVAAGGSRRALVVGADVMSRITHPSDKKVYPLFGDGAGAVVLAPGDTEQGFAAYTLGSEGHRDVLWIPTGGSREPIDPTNIEQLRHYLKMDGRAVFKWAVRLLADTVRDTLDHAGLTAGDLDLVVLHQANIRIIDAAVKELQLDPSRVVVNLDRYGNTSAGSIPLALDEAYAQGRVKPGDRVMMCGFGAGLSWGAGLFCW